jgi:hypothetical protein
MISLFETTVVSFGYSFGRKRKGKKHRNRTRVTELLSSLGQSYITTDGQLASRPVCLGVRHLRAAHDQVFISV